MALGPWDRLRGVRQFRIQPVGETPTDGDYVFCLGFDQIDGADIQDYQIGDLVTVVQNITLDLSKDFITIQARFKQPAGLPVQTSVGNAQVERYLSIRSPVSRDASILTSVPGTFQFERDTLRDVTLSTGLAIAGVNQITGPAYNPATGTITAVASASLFDAETFTIPDGVGAPTVFEFNSSGGVASTNTAVPITGGMTAGNVRDAMITAINGNPALRVTAFIGSSTQVTLVNDTPGPHGNLTITDTVVNAGFVHTGMQGGVDGADGSAVFLMDPGRSVAGGPTPIVAVMSGCYWMPFIQIDGYRVWQYEAMAASGRATDFEMPNLRIPTSGASAGTYAVEFGVELKAMSIL